MNVCGVGSSISFHLHFIMIMMYLIMVLKRPFAINATCRNRWIYLYWIGFEWFSQFHCYFFFHWKKIRKEDENPKANSSSIDEYQFYFEPIFSYFLSTRYWAMFFFLFCSTSIIHYMLCMHEFIKEDFWLDGYVYSMNFAHCFLHRMIGKLNKYTSECAEEAKKNVF